MNNCITCKKNNKGDNWRNCRLKCHYKYEQQKKDEIYKLKEEKEQLQKRFNDYQDRKIEENANLIKRLDIADKKLTVFSRELKQANEEIKKLIEINHELAEEHKTIGQDLYAEIKEYRKEKENLKQQLEIDKNQINYFIEENEKLKQYLLNIAMIIEELEQQYDDIKDFTEIKEIKEIKEILREVNQ